MGFISKKFSSTDRRKIREGVEELKKMLHDGLMKQMVWNEFLERLSALIDEYMLKKSAELGDDIAGGKCIISGTDQSVDVNCTIFFVDKNDNYRKVVLTYNIKHYLFDMNDIETKLNVMNLIKEPLEFKVEEPE